jgi:hypothetical protein
MTGQTKLILYVDLPGVHPYEIGPEIWQVPIADAIGDEADAIAYASTADHLGEPTPADHDRLRDRVVAEMTGALTACATRSPSSPGLTSMDRPIRSAQCRSLRQSRSSWRSSASTTSRLDRRQAGARSYAGATAPRVKRLPGTATRS